MKSSRIVIALSALSLLSAIALAPRGAAGARGAAAPKVPPAPAPACGIKSIPAAPGTTWTYKSNTGAEITVKIVDVSPSKGADGKPNTTIKVEETYGKRVINTQWTCTPTAGITMSPESFFFTGEPGGGIDMTLTQTAHEDVTFPADAGLVQDKAWVEQVKADVTRTDGGGAGATHPPAKLELERHMLVHPNDPVALAIGQWGAVKITFELRGRGIIDQEKVEIPVKRPGTFWIVKGLGIVKVEDAFDKSWELTATTLPIPAK